MSALAKEQGAINLSQGFPEFDAPDKLLKHAKKAMNAGMNQYAPMAGLPSLREQVSGQLEAYGTSYDPESEITITAGATQAIFTAVNALVKEDDEVIIFTPAYDCYAPAVEMAGGSAIYIQLKCPDYRIDWDEVRKVVNRKTRMIILNTPHNPTGMCMDENDLKELEKIVEDSDIIVLSDEVYEHIVFDGKQHASCARSPILAAQSLIVGSFGKTYHLTGWKIGYIAAPEALMTEFRKVHQYNVFCVNHPLQYAIAEFMKEDGGHVAELSSFYQKKRDLFIDALDGSRFELIPAEGTYFQLLNYSQIVDADDTEVAKQWTANPGIASIPVSVFYHNPIQEHVLRFCFAKSDETLVKAAEVLKTL
ncbi:methionine aminotransferase [Sanyastnella coralliicola]|uniref:methionine aminotransferase n=1 Tax=Sanyastnella coralliicola TaxID=3069118 RepID=UPI0027B8B9FA|nr:methionine aminotransferase [Longitalea sp. SCSIO 12813]